MNDRVMTLRLTALVLAAYGVYIASHVPAMLVGPITPLLLIGFVVQAVCALAAAVGLWRGDTWASGVIVLLGIAVAATWLVEAFVLGIVAYLQALLVALFAIVIAVLVARYVDRGGPPERSGGRKLADWDLGASRRLDLVRQGRRAASC